MCGSAGRSLSLLDPTYASKYIPIIASVSEHQPPAWPSYFTDLHVASVLMPAGIISLFWPLTSASMFLILYACTAVYFSGVMVRYRRSQCRAKPWPALPHACPLLSRSAWWKATLLEVKCVAWRGDASRKAWEHSCVYLQVRLMLVLAPAACCLAGVAVHDARTPLFNGVHGRTEAPASRKEEPLKPKKVTKGTAKVCCRHLTWLHLPHPPGLEPPLLIHWKAASVA